MEIRHKARDENYIIILIDRQQKHQHYHQAKLLNMNNLQLNQSKLKEHDDKCTYSPVGKAFEKQTKQLKIKEKTNRCYH